MSDGARIIWVLFGDIHGRDGKPITEFAMRIRGAYLRWKPKLEGKGYTLGFSQGLCTSKHAFLNLLGDDSCWAMIWHSHGNDRGQLADSNGDIISPADTRKVSKNLHFAALWGCFVGQASNEWRRVLGLSQRFPHDSTKRLVAQSIGVGAEDFDLGFYSARPAPLLFVDMASPLPSGVYNFPKWVELLP